MSWLICWEILHHNRITGLVILYIYMMKNYFRLLLVGSILFILLGLFNHQFDDTIALTQNPDEIEYVESQLGILPVSLESTSTPSIASSSVAHTPHFMGNPKLCENQISKWNDIRLFSIESGFTDRKPQMICKTGQFIHLDTDKEVPSHI